MALAAIMVGAAALTADAADRVSVQLDWVVRGNHAMFFVARDKGYFAEKDIEVAEIRKGTGSTEALSLVGAGSADFGFGDLPILVIARSQSVPVVALAAVNQRSPMGMIALAKTKTLSRPQDLNGLDIGVHAAGSTYVFLRAFLAVNGMSEADLKKKTVTPPYEGDLLHGRGSAGISTLRYRTRVRGGRARLTVGHPGRRLGLRCVWLRPLHLGSAHQG